MTQIVGIGAAPGRAQGTVRWVRTAKDLGEFQPGEVLLAKMTSPDWAEVFQKAAAVATEQGGMLCHAGIVAREEGIPAVVGVGPTLQELSDGDRVVVDGDDGSVTRMTGKGPQTDKSLEA